MISTLVFVVVTVLLGLIGLTVFSRDPKNKINQYFGLMVLFGTLWIISNFLTNESLAESYRKFFLKLDFAFACLLTLYFYFFCLNFPQIKLISLRDKIIIFIPFISLVILSFSNLIIKDIYFENSTIQFKRGSIFWIYFSFIIFYLINGLKELIKKYLKSKNTERMQIFYVLLGISIIVLITTPLNLILPQVIFIPLQIARLGIYSFLAFCVFTALAITRYHLFEIEVILTELMVVVIGILLLVQVFAAPFPLWKVINGIAFVLFCIFGYFLIRATFREIKRKKEAERIAFQERKLRIEAEKLAEETERLSRAKDQFLLSIQHHLRTPFNPIRGYISMILEGTYGEERNPKIKKKLTAIKKSSDILHNLMEELLDVQQIRMGRSILNLESVHLENLIEDVIQELKPEIDQRKISLDFKKTILPEIKIDKKRMREVIWNLLDNAIKYTLEGKIEIKTEKKKENEKESILLSISDTGIGMEKEEINYFLEGKLFERGREAKKLYGPGRGIGLAISKEFIKAHGGKMWVESEGRGKGATFYIELPMK